MWGFLTINKNTKFVLLSVHLSLQLFVFLSEVLPSMDGVRHLVQPAVRILQSLNCKFNQPYVLFSSPIPTYSAYFLSLFLFINFYAVLSLQCGRVCQAFKCNPVTDSFTPTCCALTLSFSDPHSPSCEQCTHTHTHTHCTKHSFSSSSFSCHMCPVLLLRCQVLLFFLLHIPMLCSIISPQPQLRPTRLWQGFL